MRDTYLEVRKYIISGKEVPGELAADLKRIGTPKKELDNRQQGFMNALFLFIPGSSEVYDNIIKDLE